MLEKIRNIIRDLRSKNKALHFYKQFMKEGDLCFDIGANIGSRTDIFLNLGAKVVAVEPVEECYSILEKKFNSSARFTMVKKAVGAKNGTAEIHIGNYHEVSTLSTDFIEKYSGQPQYNIKWDRTKEVELTSLDELIKEYGLPVFCKIDVEGYETEVLKGLSQTIPCLSFEYNQRLKEKALACLEILSKFEDLEYNFSSYESMNFYLPKWKNQTEFYNFIRELSQLILTGDIYVRAKTKE